MNKMEKGLFLAGTMEKMAPPAYAKRTCPAAKNRVANVAPVTFLASSTAFASVSGSDDPVSPSIITRPNSIPSRSSSPAAKVPAAVSTRRRLLAAVLAFLAFSSSISARMLQADACGAWIGRVALVGRLTPAIQL